MSVHADRNSTWKRLLCLSQALLLLLLASHIDAQTRDAELLAEGTPWQTPIIVIDSGEPGPTVMVVGGVHGDEPAGARAAAQIADWPVLRGRLIVVPRANQLGLRAGTRRTPDDEAEAFDLNRAFPVAGEPRHVLAMALLACVETYEPDWLIDLHEGYDFHRQNPDSVGASIIYTRGRDGGVDAAVRDMLARVNATVALPERRLVELGRSGPIAGSLANAAGGLGIHAMILETCRKDQRLPVRVRQHRLMVHTVLARLEMTTPEAVEQIVQVESESLRIAVFDDAGVGGAGRRNIEAIMDSTDCLTRRIDAIDIRAGVLSQFDILVCTGGSGSGQARALGEVGREAVRGYVHDGGGYVGVCGGAYLATAGYTWSLAIIDAKHLHLGSQWRRGRGMVEIEWTDARSELLDAESWGDSASPLNERDEVLYANGPIVGPADREDLPDYTVVAWFRTEISEHDAQPGLMIDTPAIICGSYGAGRVVSISPHPEATGGLEEVVRRAVRWTREAAIVD